MVKYLLPLGVFLALLIFLGVGLTINPSEVPSPLIDKPAPDFRLPRLADAKETLARKDLLGKVWLLNVWASWCVSCRQEHPVLVRFARTGAVPIYGLNYKDTREDAERWLTEYGNPYVESGFDADGQVGMDYGVYGVPETYVIDRKGVIRHKHIGPITPQVLEQEIMPLVRRLQG